MAVFAKYQRIYCFYFCVFLCFFPGIQGGIEWLLFWTGVEKQAALLLTTALTHGAGENISVRKICSYVNQFQSAGAYNKYKNHGIIMFVQTFLLRTFYPS